MYVFSFTCIVPAVIGFKNYALLPRDLKAITLYAFVSFLFEIPSNYYFYHNKNNLFILHAYTVIEFIFMAYVYSFHISKVVGKRTLLLVTVTFVAFSIVNSVFIQSIKFFNSYARCIEILLVIVFALCYVYAFIKSDDQRPLKSIPMFWINTAVIIYFTAGFFLYLVSNNMISLSWEVSKIVWNIHGLLLAGYYLSLSRALWIQAKQ